MLLRTQGVNNLAGLLLLAIMAGGAEWLLKSVSDEGEVGTQLASWRMPLIPIEESTDSIIERLQSNGKWLGVNELLEIAQKDGVEGGEDGLEQTLYTLAAIIQVDGRGAAIVVSDQGEIERVQAGDEFGGGYRLEQILSDQIKLEYAERTTTDTSDSKRSLTLKLYPENQNE